jgi:riboflavin biosynthesis pyrimidine reductase
VRILDAENCPSPDTLVADHVALPERRPADRAFIRLNMIASADGGSAVGGLSGGLANRNDHAVFSALRAHADGVLVGIGTVSAERYGPPAQPGLQIYVVTRRPDTAAGEPLFDSGRATLVIPEDAEPAPAGVPELRVGKQGMVDLPELVTALAGQVIVAEGGPTLAGSLASLGLIDEFFLTIAPRVVAGDSGRVVHGPDAAAIQWQLDHGFVDDEGFLFLRYARR